MDLNKSNSYNNSRIRCNICRQFGHTGYNCKEQFKPEICIMCGIEGHNFHSCNKKICLSVSFMKIHLYYLNFKYKYFLQFYSFKTCNYC